MLSEERDFFEDNLEDHDNRLIIGYCGYDKTPIREGDDYVEYNGKLYHKENFIQMNLGLDDKGINDD